MKAFGPVFSASRTPSSSPHPAAATTNPARSSLLKKRRFMVCAQAFEMWDDLWLSRAAATSVDSCYDVGFGLGSGRLSPPPNPLATSETVATTAATPMVTSPAASQLLERESRRSLSRPT